MVKALARALPWRKLLETGGYGTIEEGVNHPRTGYRIAECELLWSLLMTKGHTAEG
jgi:hypothetical protein